MLLRLIFSVIAGLLLAGLVSHALCDAPNPTLANPAYCGPREWMTWTTAFLFGAGLAWLLQLRRRRAPPSTPAGLPAGSSAGDAPAVVESPPADKQA
ncbi:MAG: hypothetical protein JWN73_415 [Betaproteobacteria bacterium]|nr:hypothetical protein [Betaproteobacteria bacterium]